MTNQNCPCCQHKGLDVGKIGFLQCPVSDCPVHQFKKHCEPLLHPLETKVEEFREYFKQYSGIWNHMIKNKFNEIFGEKE